MVLLIHFRSQEGLIHDKAFQGRKGRKLRRHFVFRQVCYHKSDCMIGRSIEHSSVRESNSPILRARNENLSILPVFLCRSRIPKMEYSRSRLICEEVIVKRGNGVLVKLTRSGLALRHLSREKLERENITLFRIRTLKLGA